MATTRKNATSKKSGVQTKSAGTPAPAKRGSGPAAARKVTTKADTRRNIAAKSPATKRSLATKQAAKKVTKRPLSTRTGSQTATRSGGTATQQSGARKAAGATASTAGGKRQTARPSAKTAQRGTTAAGTRNAPGKRPASLDTSTGNTARGASGGGSQRAASGSSGAAKGSAARSGASGGSRAGSGGARSAAGAGRASAGSKSATRKDAAAPAKSSGKSRSITPEQALANTKSLLESGKRRNAEGKGIPGTAPHGKPVGPQDFMSVEAQDRAREQEKGQLIHSNIHGFGNDRNTSRDHH